ncbi:4'-phosphopantetheinyl transferase family protein [Flavobacterium sp. NPDC079362]|uniref:4'-phosphopantetheinyl transferase family protein n=1 Tax=Flavobacterium sp. NPDC079362 TaxID=3390566 RepID=UPI003CFFD561
MIGNDVIDILQSRKESNWQRKGLAQKLFTIDEQLLITHDPEPEMMLWILWSMKEAAYKIYNRQTKIREYIPKKLACTIGSKEPNYCTGKVICEQNIYYTKTIITPDVLHSIAVTCPDNLNNVIEIVRKDIVKDSNGIPYLSHSTSNILQDVSISHHGRYEKVVTLSYK